jgi:hypothetical protein
MTDCSGVWALIIFTAIGILLLCVAGAFGDEANTIKTEDTTEEQHRWLEAEWQASRRRKELEEESG